MATIFISYYSGDSELATLLQRELEEKQHELRFDIDLVAADDWRRVLMEELASSDAVVALLTANALGSNFVMSEVGAARVYGIRRGTLLIPIIVGDMPVPPVIGDLWAIRMGDGSVGEISRAANQIDRALATHARRLRGRFPRIFVSHRHRDVDVATALARLLEAVFEIDRGDIRCTSVSPYRLPAGARTPDRLRAEISRAKVVFGVVTPGTAESSYVLFELGASWGQQVPTFPLLARGATQADLPAPISDLHPLDLADERDCHQLIDDLLQLVPLKVRDNSNALMEERVRELVERSQPPVPQPAPSVGAAGDSTGASGAEADRTSPGGAAAEAKEKLREMLVDSRYPDGRYLSTLCGSTGLDKPECRKYLLEIGAREVELENGEGWTFRPRRRERGLLTEHPALQPR